MHVCRGDVVLVLYPFASGRGASRRPALIVQNNRDNRCLDNAIIAQITTNMRHANDSTHLLIPWVTPEGQQASLLHDSVVSCNNLATVHEDRMHRVIGHSSGVRVLFWLPLRKTTT
jgi:mRNA interferase MazF